MPNWCTTTYKFVGDKTEIADLHSKIKRLQEIYDAYVHECVICRQNNLPEPTMPSELGIKEYEYPCIGSMVSQFGGDPKEYPCRGLVTHIELCSDNVLRIDTETAWSELYEVWAFVCKQYTDICYYFLAEEPGCEYYINSDTTGEYFPEQYQIYDRGDCTDYVNSDEELFAYIAQCVGVEKIDTKEQLDVLLKEYNAVHPDEEITYHEFLNP